MPEVQDTPKRTAAHTPGPWAYDGVRVYAPAFDAIQHYTNQDGEDIEYRQGLVALPYGCGQDVHAQIGSSQANAHLIMAAPELLAALKRVIGSFARVGGPLAVEASIVEAEAAIAKAEGR